MLIYLYVNSAFGSVASLDFGIFGGCRTSKNSKLCVMRPKLIVYVIRLLETNEILKDVARSRNPMKYPG